MGTWLGVVPGSQGRFAPAPAGVSSPLASLLLSHRNRMVAGSLEPASPHAIVGKSSATLLIAQCGKFFYARLSFLLCEISWSLFLFLSPFIYLTNLKHAECSWCAK